METTVEAQMYIHKQGGRHNCSAEYASNVEYMYTSASGDIVDPAVSSFEICMLT